MIALDLFPAIMSAGLSTYAQVVLAEVVLQSYGKRKCPVVQLPSVDIQEITGVDRCNVRRAVRELVDANILVVNGPGYSINKDYETWTPKAGPLKDRLNGSLLKWISHAPGRLGKTKNHVSTQTPKTDVGRVYLDTSEAPETCLPRHINSAPPRPPIEEHARSEELIQEIKEDKTRQSSSDPISGDSEPEYPDPERSFLMIHTGGSDTTEAEARSIWSALWAQWHSRALCQEFYEHQRWYPAHVWRAAIRKAVLQGATPRKITYVERIAAEFDAKGIPVELAPKRGESGYVPPPATEYYQSPWLSADVA